jgi:hypothetical protein
VTAVECLQQLRNQTDLSLIFEGQAPGGEVGAHFARSADGQRFVFKWSDEPSDVGYFEGIVYRVGLLRQVGYPVPRYLAPVALPGGAVIVQEAVDGGWSDEVDHELLDAILSINDLQGGHTDDAGGWTEFIRRTLTEGEDGYCVHASLRAHSQRTGALLDWIRGVGATHGQLPGHDVVHVDFHHRNMLRVDDRLSAVVDWEGCCWGDRAFDLVTFCFGLSEATVAPGVEERAWRRACEITGPEALRAYVAHMSLRRVDWTIRFHPDEIDKVLCHVERFVGFVA